MAGIQGVMSFAEATVLDVNPYSSRVGHEQDWEDVWGR